jgi:hypothetical protein
LLNDSDEARPARRAEDDPWAVMREHGVSRLVAVELVVLELRGAYPVVSSRDGETVGEALLRALPHE